MIRIANDFTLQQLIDNQCATPLADDDMLVLVVSMPFTSNPNGWVTGSIGVTYDSIKLLNTPLELADLFSTWLAQSYNNGLNGYDAVVDKLIFAVDPEGYLAVEPRPGLGFQFRKYNPFSGPFAEDSQVKDITTILGINAEINNAEAQCPLPSSKRLQVFVNLQAGEGVKVYKPTNEGDQLVATIVKGDDSTIDNNTFLNGLKNALTVVGLETIVSMDVLNDGGGIFPSFEVMGSTNDCSMVKLSIHRNSDAATGFFVKADGDLGNEDPRFIFPRAEQLNYLTLWIPATNTTPQVPFIKFRNTVPNEDHRLELIPINPLNEGTSILVKNGESLELGGSEVNGYGICLSRDLCALTGTTLNLLFDNDVSNATNATVLFVDKRRGKAIGIMGDLHLIPDQNELLNQIAALIRSSGLNVVLTIGEGNWELAISNPTEKDITTELFLPLILTEDSTPVVGISGNANTLQKTRDMSVYGANYSIAFCIAGKPISNSCQLTNTPWSNDILFDVVNLPNQYGSISVSVADAVFGGWNVGVDLTVNNTIETFIQNVISQGPPVGIEWRVSPNDINAINIRYMGGYTGDITSPNSLAYEPREATFSKMNPGPVQDNRDQPWAQGTMAETRVCLANFFTDVPVIGNCYNTDTLEGS